MRSIDNGRLALTFEWNTATIRVIDHVPTVPEPACTAVAQIQRLSSDVAKLHALCGETTATHVWLLAHLLREEGFKWLYAERADAHVLPMAQFIDDGDFAGHWRLDLAKMQERRRSRPAVIVDQKI